MSTGQNTKMLKGALFASLIPMILGGALCLSYLSGFIEELKNPRMIFEGELYMAYPVFVCFFLGTPIAAWLACKRLNKIKPSKKRATWFSSVRSGCHGATIIHFIAALVYTFMICFFYETGDLASSDSDWFGAFFMSGIINLILLVVLTLPFAIFCATIFWKVTDFLPEEPLAEIWS